MPHSKPCFTSLASFLKRFSPSILPVWTTTLSRSRRTWLSRVMEPSFTMQPGDGADLADAEHFAHLRAALVHFLEHRLQHAGHGALDLVGQLVDDRVQPDVDFFLLGHGLRRALRPDVEADDDRVRRRRQQHVGFGDRADARVQHANLDLVVRQFLKRVGQHFGRAADVGLQNDVQLLGLAFLELIVELFERDAIGLRHRHFARLDSRDR